MKNIVNSYLVPMLICSILGTLASAGYAWFQQENLKTTVVSTPISKNAVFISTDIFHGLVEHTLNASFNDTKNVDGLKQTGWFFDPRKGTLYYAHKKELAAHENLSAMLQPLLIELEKNTSRWARILVEVKSNDYTTQALMVEMKGINLFTPRGTVLSETHNTLSEVSKIWIIFGGLAGASFGVFFVNVRRFLKEQRQKNLTN